jgi:hypothetical protein
MVRYTDVRIYHLLFLLVGYWNSYRRWHQNNCRLALTFSPVPLQERKRLNYILFVVLIFVGSNERWIPPQLQRDRCVPFWGSDMIIYYRHVCTDLPVALSYKNLPTIVTKSSVPLHYPLNSILEETVLYGFATLFHCVLKTDWTIHHQKIIMSCGFLNGVSDNFKNVYPHAHN